MDEPATAEPAGDEPADEDQAAEGSRRAGRRGLGTPRTLTRRSRRRPEPGPVGGRRRVVGVVDLSLALDDADLRRPLRRGDARPRPRLRRPRAGARGEPRRSTARGTSTSAGRWRGRGTRALPVLRRGRARPTAGSVDLQPVQLPGRRRLQARARAAARRPRRARGRRGRRAASGAGSASWPRARRARRGGPHARSRSGAAGAAARAEARTGTAPRTAPGRGVDTRRAAARCGSVRCSAAPATTGSAPGSPGRTCPTSTAAQGYAARPGGGARRAARRLPGRLPADLLRLRGAPAARGVRGLAVAAAAPAARGRTSPLVPGAGLGPRRRASPRR